MIGDIQRPEAPVEGLPPRLNVAAYCRVSTDQMRQLTSFDTQVAAYTAQIAAEPDWELAGIYADEGFSGTSAAKRPEFQRMLRDCNAGLIDLILCKSISRFSRNTLECLQLIRLLKGKGIDLVFEKEKIDTRKPYNDLLLTVWAAFAQEESRNISENVKWGIRKHYENGQARWSRIYGYAKEGGEEYVIVEDEAAVVRRVFRLYERGWGMKEIAAALTREGVRNASGTGKWHHSTIGSILGNERYAGDIRLQKQYTADYLAHRSIPNDGTVPTYYLRGHHPPIVERKLWDRVQAIRRMKCRLNGEAPQYPYAGRLICPCCGGALVRRRLDGNTAPWVCGDCRRFAVRHELLNEALLRAWAAFRPKEGALRDLKGKNPRMESVEYWWLDEAVERVEFEGRGAGGFAMRIHWRDGTAGLSGALPGTGGGPLWPSGSR